MNKLLYIAVAVSLLIGYGFAGSVSQDKELKKRNMVTKVDDKERLYKNVNYDQVWKAAVRAANEKFSVAHSDKESGILEFHTGMSFTSSGFRVGATISETDEDEIRVKLNTQKKKQLFAFGAGGRISEKFFKALEENLKDIVGK